MEFLAFPKMARLSRPCVITEKIDGTNAQILIEDATIMAGSRSRWITPGKTTDNHGFAAWVEVHRDELIQGLGDGRHYGEWWGKGIQRGYGLDEKRFSLFNVARWGESRPECCDIVPTLFEGMFDTLHVEAALETLRREGSKAAPGFMKPEGVVVFHQHGNVGFKKTLENDEVPKSEVT